MRENFGGWRLERHSVVVAEVWEMLQLHCGFIFGADNNNVLFNILGTNQTSIFIFYIEPPCRTMYYNIIYYWYIEG